MVKSAKAELGAEVPGTADEGAVARVEAKEAVRGTGDADTLALAEEEGGCRTAWAGDRAEPERTEGTEVCPVEGAVNAQSGGEATGTAREVEQARGFAVTLHLLDSFQGLEGADEDATADSGGLRADVEHEVIAVAEIDVGVATAEKHRAIARSRTAKVVRGGVARRVGLGLDDAAAKAGAGEFANDDFADQKTGQLDGVRGEFDAAEAPDGNGSLTGYRDWQARKSSEAVRKSNLTPRRAIQ